MGIRKLFDFKLFTQQDLMWLDDIMPESTKKKKDDARKKKEEEEKIAAEVNNHEKMRVDNLDSLFNQKRY